MAHLIALIVVASVLAQTYAFVWRPRLDGRIVGGQDADIKDYPYQLSLQYREEHFCGASILSKTVALTAAHCTNDYIFNVNVRAGSTFKHSGGEIVIVSEMNEHPLFNIITAEYDVSVLKLTKALSLGSSVKIQPLGQEVPVGTLAVVTGWGRLYEEGPTSRNLQKVEVAHVEQSECNKANSGKVTDSMTCYGSLGKDSCHGDSGGPLVYDGHQVGVVSWGYGCARPNNPGVYAKISYDKINNYINQYLD